MIFQLVFTAELSDFRGKESIAGRRDRPRRRCRSRFVDRFDRVFPMHEPLTRCSVEIQGVDRDGRLNDLMDLNGKKTSIKTSVRLPRALTNGTLCVRGTWGVG